MNRVPPTIFLITFLLTFSRLPSEALSAISMSTTDSNAPSSPFFAECNGAATTITVKFPKNAEKASDESALPRFGVGYWSIRGLGAPLRMMLCAAKVDHTVFLYDIVENNENGGWNSDYFSVKSGYINTYQQPLWNLPFIVDRNERMTIMQTNACFAYLGRACHMMGDGKKQESDCEQLLCEIYDLRNKMTGFAYSGGITAENDKDAFRKEVETTVKESKRYLQKLDNWLENEAQSDSHDSKKAKVDVCHLVGGKFTAPDFHLFEMLDQFNALSNTVLEEDILEDFPRLRAFYSGFAALAENQFYLKSWLHNELPFNNCMAKFGSYPGPKTYKRGDVESATWRKKGNIVMSDV